jgi:Ran GTPase-activating protein (RanGAP) involved in mRNA processing and transport
VGCPYLYPVILDCIQENDYRNEELEEAIDLCEISSLINLNGLKVNDNDIEIVLNKGLFDKQCQSLILWNNCLTTYSISRLSSILNENKSLTKLSLVNNHLNDQSIEYLSSSLSLSNCTLKELILGSNQITDQGLIYLSNMLKINETLIGLGLQNNQITDQGIQYLSKVKNDSIEQISLYSNKLITDDSINYITNILHKNKSLNQFWIWDCQLSKQGINQLRQSIQTKINFQLIL